MIRGEIVSWGYVDLTDWIPIDSDIDLRGYGSALRILKSTLVAYTVGGAELSKAEIGILDLVSKTKTVKYKFDTLLGTSFIRFYDKATGRYKTIGGWSGGWGIYETESPCGNNVIMYVIDDVANIDVKCMPYTSDNGSIGFCFYDSKTNYIYCGGDYCGRRIYRLNADGSYESDWTSYYMSGDVCDALALIPATETDLYLLEYRNAPYVFYATVDVLDRWKSTQYIENMFTMRGTNATKRIIGYSAWSANKKYFCGDVGSLVYTQDFVNWVEIPVPTYVTKLYGIYLGKLVLFDTTLLSTSSTIYIYDSNTLQQEASISINDASIHFERSTDPPFFIAIDPNNRRFKVRALTYNNMIPMLQYDPSNGVRVIDILTGKPVSGFKINVYYSRFMYPINIQPMRDPDFVLTPSDYTPLPSPPSQDRTVANMWITV
jgi:hypothetical protein